MKSLPRILLLTALLVATLVSTAMADWDRHDGGSSGKGNWEGHEWDHNQHDEYWSGDIHRFYDHDFDRWRSGNWFHGFHASRNGWWWNVGNLWYYYSAPVYPYPDPYIPPAVIEERAPALPAPPVAVVPGARPQLMPPQYWYYCSDPAGYFPYIPHCESPWQRVTATNKAIPGQP